MFWSFVRTTPEARARFMQFSFYSSLVIGLLYIGTAVFSGDDHKEAHQDAFIAWCQGESAGDCQALLKANHHDCYALSGGKSGGHSATAFETERYHRCLVVGVDAWRLERAEQVKRERLARQREKAEGMF